MTIFAGHLPPCVLGLVVEWAMLHRAELVADWERAQTLQSLAKIEPLR